MGVAWLAWFVWFGRVDDKSNDNIMVELGNLELTPQPPSLISGNSPSKF